MTSPAPDVTELRSVLGDAFGVAVEDVWLQDETPVPDRVAPVAAQRWEAAPGDVTWLLDVACDDDVPLRPSERGLGSWLARRLGSGVLFPAEPYPPSAYWLAGPDGSVRRARVYDLDPEDENGPTAYVIDAVGPEAGNPEAQKPAGST